MEHTRLSLSSFGRYAAVVLSMGVVSAGFGAVDMMMVAPLGVEHVASVGQADVLAAAVFAFFLGLTDAVASRLAISEGRGEGGARLPLYASAFGLLLLPLAALASSLSLALEPILAAAGQEPSLIGPMADYLSWRLHGAALLLAYFMSSEALKLCGFRAHALRILALGFLFNAGLNWLFLYGGAAGIFATPESAVAASTVCSHGIMAAAALWSIASQLRASGTRFERAQWGQVLAEARAIAAIAPGMGVRQLNDYAGTVIPLLFIGTMGVATLAAAQVATRIYILVCRVPQACFGASFAFYGYALGASSAESGSVARRLLKFSAAPTLVVALLALAFGPLLVELLGGPEVEAALAFQLSCAYLLLVPAYLFEQFHGDLLTVHQRSTMLSAWSSGATWLLTIPLAALSVFIWGSAFLAIVSKGAAMFLLALAFRAALRRDHWDPLAAAHG